MTAESAPSCQALYAAWINPHRMDQWVLLPRKT